MLPPALQSEPELFEDLGETWTTFTELHRTRGILEGRTQPLSWQEIRAYLDLRGIRCEEERDELIRYVVALDTAYIKHISKKG